MGVGSMKKEMKATYGVETDLYNNYSGYLYIDYTVGDANISVTGRTGIIIAGYGKKEITPDKIKAKLNELVNDVEKSYTRLMEILKLVMDYADEKGIDFSANIRIG
jgi:pyruvate/2-oxoacid:ferredoxin oxidoreductase alpha subunit